MRNESMCAWRSTARIGASALASLAALPASAADLQLKVGLPRLTVAEYHPPYVAMWIERASDAGVAANLAVWYDLHHKKHEGEKWLKDLRAWWRKSGRELAMPMDGLSSATRPAGDHAVNLAGAKAALDALPAGDYVLMVEAAREVGGRELVKLPFAWPPKAAAALSARGEHEVGTVSLSLQP